MYLCASSLQDLAVYVLHVFYSPLNISVDDFCHPAFDDAGRACFKCIFNDFFYLPMSLVHFCLLMFSLSLHSLYRLVCGAVVFGLIVQSIALSLLCISNLLFKKTLIIMIENSTSVD